MYIKNKLDLNSTKDHCNMTTRNNNFEFLYKLALIAPYLQK